MRKIAILLLVCFLQAVTISAQEKGEFVINGKFPTSYYDGLTIVLNEIDYKESNNIFPKDSITIEGDKFVFKGKLEKPISLRYITVQDNDNLAAIVVVEEGTINIEMTDIPQMSGTAKNDELREFSNEQIKNHEELEAVLESAQELHKMGELDESSSDAMEQHFKDQQLLMTSNVNEFVSKNMSNELGEFFFTIYAPNLNTRDIESLYAASSEEFQKGFIVKSLMNQYVWSLGDLREGKEMKGIDLKKLDGEVEDVAVQFAKGKVVLIDFWASWCGPCIKTMPTIVKLYDRYRDSGFEIVGISLDEDESAWKGAIKRLNMEWPQYIDDGRGWRGAAAQQYQIKSIPQTYLLDKEGKIVGHNLSGVALIDKIEELLQ